MMLLPPPEPKGEKEPSNFSSFHRRLRTRFLTGKKRESHRFLRSHSLLQAATTAAAWGFLPLHQTQRRFLPFSPFRKRGPHCAGLLTFFSKMKNFGREKGRETQAPPREKGLKFDSSLFRGERGRRRFHNFLALPRASESPHNIRFPPSEKRSRDLFPSYLSMRPQIRPPPAR